MATDADLATFVPRLLLDQPPSAPRHWQAHGTMAFVDISGFTSLSEQLARRGRVGAEDLVSTLTRVFTVLMSASDDGGDVVKFAGDAMLLWYAGPDHEAHACHAALTAQRVLAVVGSVRLAGARARLRMSAGVHTGTFHFMLTGRGAQNLVVTGPDLTRMLELQDRAQAGEVLVSTEVADALPHWAVLPRPEESWLLRRLPQLEGVPSDPFAGRAGRTDLVRYLPVQFQRRPDLLAADSDHRRAAMGFVQVSGLDRQLRSQPLAAVDALTEVVEAACARTDVTLLDVDIAKDGFRYFLSAGAPVAVEDPEGRLLRALVDICAVESPLQVRAGASSGQVFAGRVGTTSRRTFSVMGDTTNLAARLTARSTNGQVLASEAMIRRSQSAFSLTRRTGISVKGKASPVPVSVVTGVLGPRTSERGAEPTLVGREAELEQAARLVAGAAEGRGGILELVGEPGLGKTRLAHEAADRSGARQVWVTADAYGEQVPFRMLSSLLRPLLGLKPADDAEAALSRLTEAVERVAPQVAPWLPLVAAAVGARVPTTTAVAELDPRFRTARFHDAVTALLTGLLTEPTVVVVDDAQWVDQTSADALAAALAEVGSRPWAVLLTRRDGPSGLRVDGPDTSRLELTPLGAGAAHDLVVEASGGLLRTARVDELVGRADGNPYFLLELAGAGSEELPDTVEELIGLRIDDLDAAGRDLLRHAAALGSRFPLALLGAAAGVDRPREALVSHGLDAFVAVEDETVVFHRELQREVAYGQLTFRRRREVHRAAVEAMVARPGLVRTARLPLLSLHAWAGGLWPEAHDYSAQAAAEAKASFANDEAVVFLRRTLDAGRRAGRSEADLHPVQVDLADLLKLTGQHDEALRVLGAARRSASDVGAVAEVVDRQARVLQEADRLPASDRAARRLLQLAGSIPAPRGVELAAESFLLRAGNRFRTGDADACRHLARQAETSARGLPEGPTRTVLVAQALALHDTASTELEGRAGEHGLAPMRMFHEIGDLYREGRFANNAAIGEYYEGRWEAAVDLYRHSRDIADRIGDVFSVAVAQLNIGEVLSLQGIADEAVDALRSSLRQLTALRATMAAAHAACYLGYALQQAGDPDGSGSALDRSAALFAGAGVAHGFPVDDLETRRMSLQLLLGRSHRALEMTQEFLGRPTQPATSLRARALRIRAVALHETGAAEDALSTIADALAVARGLPLGYEAALTLLELVAWGPADQRATAHAEAVALLDRLGAGAVAAGVRPSEG